MKDVKKAKLPSYFDTLLILWALLLVITLALTITTTDTKKNRNYDIQYEAAAKSEEAMNAIKARKEYLGISLPNEDKYESGMLGPLHTQIQTTEGDQGAKRTSTNPNFAAVYIEMFRKAGLKKGDEIAIITSGSFPALNIQATIAAQVYELKFVSMSGIGASSYGATDVNFTYFDMSEYLYEQGYFSNKLDYVSFGGGFDDGSEFPVDVYNTIKARIDASGVKFINEADFKTNINLRLTYIYEKCPNVKLLLNVGGSIVSMGSGYTKAVNYRGLVMPTYMTNNSKSTDDSHKGLLEIFLERGLPIIQMLNISKIAYEYGLPQDPVGSVDVGMGSVYKEVKYHIAIPITGISVSLSMFVVYIVMRRKYNI